MKISLTIFLIFFSFSLSAQTIERLDEKNGYKKFKLGSDYTLYKNDLAQTKVSKDLPNDPRKLHNYTGSDYTHFLGVNFEKIVLGFYKNKLANIMIDFPAKDNDYYYSKILKDLEAVYGKSEELTPDENGEKYNFWEGKNTTLILTQYSDENNIESFQGKINISIRIKNIDEQIILDDL